MICIPYWLALAVVGSGLVAIACALVYGFISGYNEGQEAGRREG